MAYLADETTRALDVLRKIAPGTHVEQLMYLLHRRLLDVEKLPKAEPVTTTPDVPFCVCASWKGHVEGLKYCARCGKMRGEAWSKAERPIIAGPTPTADTPANRSAADGWYCPSPRCRRLNAARVETCRECHSPRPASTIPTEETSSPLATQTEDAGPAAVFSPRTSAIALNPSSSVSKGADA